jgi:RNA 2',3'-cyclic 3'-phosphodiesterase
MRTFVAYPLPPEVRSLLVKIQENLRSISGGVRWSEPDSIHLTFKFLGEISAAILPSLTESLRTSTQEERPFSLQLHRLGAFPDLRRPRVIWCGLDGDLAALDALQGKIEQACIREGFAPEEHPFRPHLTLGRVRAPGNLLALTERMRSCALLEAAFSVDKYHIYQSILKPHGAEHKVLATIDLRDSSSCACGAPGDA